MVTERRSGFVVLFASQITRAFRFRRQNLIWTHGDWPGAQNVTRSPTDFKLSIHISKERRVLVRVSFTWAEGNLLENMISTLKNSNRTVFERFMAQKLNRGQRKKFQTSTSHKTVTERSCAAFVRLFQLANYSNFPIPGSKFDFEVCEHQGPKTWLHKFSNFKIIYIALRALVRVSFTWADGNLLVYWVPLWKTQIGLFLTYLWPKNCTSKRKKFIFHPVIKLSLKRLVRLGLYFLARKYSNFTIPGSKFDYEVSVSPQEPKTWLTKSQKDVVRDGLSDEFHQ